MAKKATTRTGAKASAKKTGKRAGEKKAGSGMPAKRADLGAPVEMYFTGLAAGHRKVAERLHGVITANAPKATHAIKWGMPVYEHRGMLCYIRSRPKYVTFGFYESGTSLDEPRGLLEGTGDAMRHIKLDPTADVDEKYLGGLVRQAVKWNEKG